MLPFLQLSMDSLVRDFSLLASQPSVDGINTGKRRTDGSRSDTRLGSATTERWASERFRQVMLLILEFRRNWPTQSLLSMDDVEAIRTAVDNALYRATSNGHVADSEKRNACTGTQNDAHARSGAHPIPPLPPHSLHSAPPPSLPPPVYDSNPTCWAIWLVQRAHSIKAGGWQVESVNAQRLLTFESLYNWLRAQHSRDVRHNLKDATTGRIIHRYKLPFKPMRIPPDPLVRFRFKKSATRLSDWIVSGGPAGATPVGLAEGVISMAPPAIVPRPPLAAQRDARAASAWQRATSAAQARSTGRRAALRSITGESDGARETRQVLDAVMLASSETESTASAGSEHTGGDGPSGAGGVEDPGEGDDDEYAAALLAAMEEAESTPGQGELGTGGTADGSVEELSASQLEALFAASSRALEQTFESQSRTEDGAATPSPSNTAQRVPLSDVYDSLLGDDL